MCDTPLIISTEPSTMCCGHSIAAAAEANNSYNTESLQSQYSALFHNVLFHYIYIQSAPKVYTPKATANYLFTTEISKNF